jgi:hypothetical protein
MLKVEGVTTAVIKQACTYLIEIGKSNDPADPANTDTLQKIHDLSRGQPMFARGRPRFYLGILGIFINGKTLSNPSLLSNSLL